MTEYLRPVPPVNQTARAVSRCPQNTPPTDDELEAKNVDSLIVIADAVFRFKPSEPKTPVVPIAAKSKELKKEVEDGVKPEREKPSEIFADISKEYNLENVK